jgi:hypothetical protein
VLGQYGAGASRRMVESIGCVTRVSPASSRTMWGVRKRKNSVRVFVR